MKRKMTSAIVTIFLVCLGTMTLQAKQTRRVDAGSLPLAKVNGEPVTSKDLLDLFTDRHSGHARFLGGDREARQFLDLVIDDRLLVQEAYDIGLDQDEAVRQLVDEFVADKATKYLISREVDEKARPTAEEVRQIWEGLGFYVQGYQLAVETRAEAEELRRMVVRGEDLEALARSCSTAPSRLRGGAFVAGWGQFSPQWESVVFQLAPGEVSPVIETPDGFEVIYLVDRDNVEKPPLADVSSNIEAVLAQRKLEARKAAFSSELWQKYQATLQPLELSPRALLAMLSSAPDTVVVTWQGGGKLTVSQIFKQEELRALAALPPQRARHEIDQQLRTTVNSPLVALEAVARKIGEIPEIAGPAEKYRDYTMESALFRDHVFRDLVVSDEEARKYYDEHRSEFVDPEQRHVAHLLLSTEAEAGAVRQKLASGADFSETARKASRDYTTAGSDGDLGWITADRVPPQFKEVLSLGTGALSQPIQSAQGWHVVKVLEIKPPRQLGFEEVHAKVNEKALLAKKQEARAFWVAKLRKAASIEVFDEAIRKFVVDNQMGDVNAAPSVQHAIDAGPMRPPSQ